MLLLRGVRAASRAPPRMARGLLAPGYDRYVEYVSFDLCYGC